MEDRKITIITQQGEVEESAGKRKFCLTLDKNLMDYEKRMLCESGCPYTLPMHFISDEGKDRAFYDFTGFVQLEEYIKRKHSFEAGDRENGRPVSDILNLLSGILECLKGMERYLFYPERYSIHPDTIFVELDHGQVTVAFFPNDEPELTLQARILLLIDRINEICRDDDTDKYLNKLKEAIYSRNPGLDGMTGILGTIQRDVSYIYWSTSSFRRTEVSETPEKEDDEKRTALSWKKTVRRKSAAIQAVFAAVLAAVLLLGKLDAVNFAGLAILAAGLDIWIMRKLRLSGSTGT